jgi:hypothetical protein
MASYLNAAGERAELPLLVQMYAEAGDAGQTLPQWLSTNYPTDAGRFGSTFDQLCASEGIAIKANRELGIRASLMSDILDARPSMSAGVTVKDAVPASRILFPAVFLQAIEDRLVANLTMTADAFDKMIAIDDSVAGDRYSQPQINYTKPSAARSQGISQLASPASMLTITTSDRDYKIPTFSLGLEISDQAIKASTLDLVTLSLARQISVQRNERAQNYMVAVLNGDVDNGEVSLSSLSKSRSTTSLDSLASGGVITQKAWVKFMTVNSQLRTLSHIVTDIDGAMAIENRTGKPVITGDNPMSPRMNTLANVMNPLWPADINLFLTVDANWPASTIMGLDSRYALRRVRNLNAEYQAIEAYVMKRSQAMRFDFGEHVTRLFNDAFDVLTIA